MPEPEIDLDAMKQLLNYDPESGKIAWKNDMNRGRIPAGTEVGSLYPDGYKRLNINGKMHMAHRLGYALGTGQVPTGIVDHDDNNRANNSLANLRIASALQNAHNTSISRRNTTGVKGVYFDKYHQKYRARVMVGGKQHHLGLFKDLEAAKAEQDAARTRLHGDYANSGEANSASPVVKIAPSEDEMLKVAKYLMGVA